VAELHHPAALGALYAHCGVDRPGRPVSVGSTPAIASPSEIKPFDKRVDKTAPGFRTLHSRRSLQATAELGIDWTRPSSSADLKAIVAADFGDLPLIDLRWR
jgi:hypothetical protein